MKEPQLEKAYIVTDAEGKHHLYFLKNAAEKHFRKESEKYENNQKQLIFWLDKQFELT